MDIFGILFNVLGIIAWSICFYQADENKAGLWKIFCLFVVMFLGVSLINRL